MPKKFKVNISLIKDMAVIARLIALVVALMARELVTVWIVMCLMMKKTKLVMSKPKLVQATMLDGTSVIRWVMLSLFLVKMSCILVKMLVRPPENKVGTSLIGMMLITSNSIFGSPSIHGPHLSVSFYLNHPLAHPSPKS